MFEVSRRPLNTQSSQCDEIIYYEQSFDVATLNTHTRCRLLTWLKNGGGPSTELPYVLGWRVRRSGLLCYRWWSEGKPLFTIHFALCVLAGMTAYALFLT